jgi:molybdopterin converting factor subunit 1
VNDIKVVFFAILRDKTGRRTFELEIKPGTTVRQLKNILVEHFPPLRDVIEHSLAAVNREYSADETIIPAQAEVAFFPPVSGGRNA